MSIMDILERTERYAEEVGRLKGKIEAKDARIQSLKEMVREMGGDPGDLPIDDSVSRGFVTYEELNECAQKQLRNKRLCTTGAEVRNEP